MKVAKVHAEGGEHRSPSPVSPHLAAEPYQASLADFERIGDFPPEDQRVAVLLDLEAGFDGAALAVFDVFEPRREVVDDGHVAHLLFPQVVESQGEFHFLAAMGRVGRHDLAES